MDPQLKQVIETIHELKEQALNDKCEKEVEGDTHNYTLYMGKDMAYAELLTEIDWILNPEPAPAQ